MSKRKTKTDFIFKLEFQTEIRELRYRKVFENEEPGSQLQSIAFEITDTEGNVDENINDEEEPGESHTLVVMSKSNDAKDSSRYSFHHGRCTIPSARLPHTEWILSCSYSNDPKLNIDVEVHVRETCPLNCSLVFDIPNEDIDKLPIVVSSKGVGNPRSLDIPNEGNSSRSARTEEPKNNVKQHLQTIESHVRELDTLSSRRSHIENALAKLRADVKEQELYLNDVEQQIAERKKAIDDEKEKLMASISAKYPTGLP